MIVSAMTGEKGALKQAQYRQAWGKGATTLEEYDYYLRGHDQYMKYTKEGIERSGEIWREGLAKFPSSPLLKVKLGWHHMMRVVIFVSDDPPADIRKAGELARQVLANEHLSPQVARLANWLMSYVLVRERDFDGALAAADKTVALAPYDTFMLSRLMMVLVQAGRPDQALQWADQVAARDPALGWFYNYRRGWAYLVLGRFGEAVDALTQTEFNDAHLLLAIAYVRLGRMADARAEVVKMMKINPAITSASVAARTLLSRPCNPRPLRPRSRTSGLAGEIAAFRPAERGLLLAQRHAQCADECPLLGAKRTLTRRGPLCPPMTQSGHVARAHGAERLPDIVRSVHGETNHAQTRSSFWASHRWLIGHCLGRSTIPATHG